MLLGGYIPKKLKLRCRGIIRLCFICMAICLLFSPTFLINCPDQPISGLDTPYIKEREVQVTSYFVYRFLNNFSNLRRLGVNALNIRHYILSLDFRIFSYIQSCPFKRGL